MGTPKRATIIVLNHGLNIVCRLGSLRRFRSNQICFRVFPQLHWAVYSHMAWHVEVRIVRKEGISKTNQAPRKHFLKMQSITTVFNSFGLLINSSSTLESNGLERNFLTTIVACLSQQLFQKMLQSLYVGDEKAGEPGKKCKALSIKLVFHDMGGLLLKASKVFTY